MDQAAPSDQVVLRHQRKRRQDANLDSRSCIRTYRYYQKTYGSRSEPLQNSTDFKFGPFRQKAHFTGIFGAILQFRKT